MNNLRSKVSELYNKYGFRASPVLDQYFLVSKGVIDRLIRYAELNENDTVLEVGPGLGFITEQLCRNAGNVVAVEKDKKLQSLLAQEFEQYKNILFIFDDFLKVNPPAFNKIVSNIPYTISAPLTFKLLDYDFEVAVLFFQKEFGQKMLSKPGSSNYGRLSVMVQYYFEVEMKEIVPRNSFYPQPKTDSIVVVLKKKDIQRDHDFDVFVRELFRYKNKKVRNAVQIAFKKELEDDRKVFTLTVEQVHELYNQLK